MHVPLGWGPIVDIGDVHYDHGSGLLWACLARTTKRQSLIEIRAVRARWDDRDSIVVVDHQTIHAFSLELDHAAGEPDRLAQIELSQSVQHTGDEHVLLTIVRTKARHEPEKMVVRREDMTRLVPE